MENKVWQHLNIKMKNLTIILFTLLGFLMNSQDIKTELIKKGWANGCYGCGYGSNYTLTISCKNVNASDIIVKSICADFHQFNTSELKIKLNNKENSMIIRFGWSDGMKETEEDPEKKSK